MLSTYMLTFSSTYPHIAISSMLKGLPYHRNEFRVKVRSTSIQPLPHWHQPLRMPYVAKKWRVLSLGEAERLLTGNVSENQSVHHTQTAQKKIPTNSNF